MTEGTAGKGTRRASLGAIFLVVFLDLVGFGIIIPQLGVYAVRFEASAFVVGLLLSVYSGMQLLFAPVLGRLSDRYGRRPVLLYSVAGSAVGYVLFGIAGSLPVLFLSRIIDGISGGNIAAAQAYVADVTTDEDRARGMGMIGAAFGLGFILGPAIGGFVGGRWGNAGIGFVAAALAAINWLFIFLWLPESRRRGAQVATAREPLHVALRALTLPRVGLALTLFLIFSIAFSQMEGTFSVFLIQRFLVPDDVTLSGALWEVQNLVGPEVAKRASERTAWIFVVIGVVSTLVQGGLVGPLRRRFGEPNLILAGTVLLAAALLAIPFAPSYGWLFLPMCVLALGSGLMHPSTSAYISIHAPKDRQGMVLGAFQSMGSSGRIVGPALGGLWFSALGEGWPYFSAACMMVVCMGLAVSLRLGWRNR